MRTDWTNYFLDIASLVSTRSTCKRAQHGALLVRDKTILSTGYNGAPRSIEDCSQKNVCMRVEAGVLPGEKYELCHAVHAEQNAIINAARAGVSIVDSTMFVTGMPCLICAKMLINAGVQGVVFPLDKRYNNETVRGLLNAAKIEVLEVLP